ncbi:DUF2752 domain-containing protein (plasmid) [Cellulomonas sp. WB94]|uniref:DUF2752 domain-containing protein n=1 Tax=Cellulomonas sp. WB94 TaxID=2173174 RepID=UPI000D564876|nr:DUF2752 domain-containing protein [Cellulomonas sp. WB94]PVU81499.1 DUF2752 domain-containing protein [Cellulomonas sp. WB94]
MRHPVADLDRLRGPLVVGGLVAAATAYVAVVDPSSPGHYLGCPLYVLTGHFCAGCGALRATHDLAHGDLAGAWAMNPLWVVVVPLLVVAWLCWTARSWCGPAAASDVPAVRRGVWVPWVVLVVTVAFTVLRNVPVLAPWLAP